MQKVGLSATVTVLALMLTAPAANATPKEAKGCPAEPSVWTEVQFGRDPYTANSLYTFYFVTNPDAGEAFAEANGLVLPGDAAAAYDLLEQIVAPIDRNGDFDFCAWWIGGTPGQADYFISVVDNNSNAQY